MFLNVQTNSFFWLLLSVLVSWRITAFICYEEGPCSIFNRLRLVMYKMRLGTLVDCFHCTGFWVSLVVVLLIYSPSKYLIFIVFGVSGAVSLAENICAGYAEHENPEDD